MRDKRKFVTTMNGSKYCSEGGVSVILQTRIVKVLGLISAGISVILIPPTPFGFSQSVQKIPHRARFLQNPFQFIIHDQSTIHRCII
jgi:hypothetical protein